MPSRALDYLARRQHESSTKLEDRKADRARNLALFQIAYSYAAIGIRSLLLFNGGAIIGLLTFIGNLWKSDDKTKPLAIAMTIPIALFAFGVGLGLATCFASYLSQLSYIDGRRNAWAEGWAEWQRIAAIVCGVLSWACLMAGSICAIMAFRYAR